MEALGGITGGATTRFVIRGKTSKKKRPPSLEKPPDPPAVAMLLDRFEKLFPLRSCLASSQSAHVAS